MKVENTVMRLRAMGRKAPLENGNYALEDILSLGRMLRVCSGCTLTIATHSPKTVWLDDKPYCAVCALDLGALQALTDETAEALQLLAQLHRTAKELSERNHYGRPDGPRGRDQTHT